MLTVLFITYVDQHIFKIILSYRQYKYYRLYIKYLYWVQALFLYGNKTLNILIACIIIKLLNITKTEINVYTRQN